jgi:hypothetical protein
MNNAATLLAIANLNKRSRYQEKQATVAAAPAQKSNMMGIYLGFDATIGQAQVKITETGQTMTARVITNGHIGVGQRVMVKVDGQTAFVNEMPAR